MKAGPDQAMAARGTATGGQVISNGPRPDANRTFWLVAALFGFFSLVLLVYMVVRTGRHTTYVVDNLAQLAAGVVATALCAKAAHWRQQRWTGWALLTGSLAVAVGGNAIWFYYNVIVGVGVVTSSLMGDICAVVALPLAIGAVLSFPGAWGTGGSRVRDALDALLVLTGMFFITWALVLGPVYRHTSGGLAVRVFNLGYPLGDMVVASLVIILATRTSRLSRASLGLVSAGLLWMGESDSSFSYLSALHRYGIGNLTDVGWVLGYLLIALGALWACGHHPLASAARAERPTLRFLVGPNVPLLGVLVVAAWEACAHRTLDRISQISFMAVVLTMSARQFLVLADHLNLSHQLEAKVEERTLELEHQVYHDGLTGLANRALFNRYLDDAIADRGTCCGLVVFLIDLHNFKHVNDIHGHQVGDELLRLAADRLRAILRDTDFVARVGGDEFGVLLDSQGAQLDGQQLAHLVSTAFTRPFAIGQTCIAVEAAMGVAAGGQEETCSDDLLRDAGLALSVAKAKGGSCCEVFSPLMHSSILEALRTEEEMRVALERQEFVVYYQPVVDLATVSIQGLEALVRCGPSRTWLHRPRQVHPGSGVDGDHQRHRGLGTGPGLPGRRGHGQAQSAALDKRQRLGRPARRRKLCRHCFRSPRNVGPRPVPTDPRDHRDGHHERRPSIGPGPNGPAQTRPQDSHRRFRHRLLFARCPALPTRRHSEDRQVVRH